MHEFELGVWKRIFTHLLRILECIKGATNQLNQRSVSFLESIILARLIFLIRFRGMPTFGRDSIRRFSNSVSELKKLGARDYENLLQVVIFSFIRFDLDLSLAYHSYLFCSVRYPLLKVFCQTNTIVF